MPFIISEDEALKQHLKGMTVTDNDGTHPVKVWFRLPEKEERPVEYPYVAIDLADVTEANERSHRGELTSYGYVPEGYEAPPPGSVLKGEFPIPVDLLYTITTHARYALHDRQIQGQIMGGKIPFRYGHLEVPADNTVRSMFLLDVRPMDRLDVNNKRDFSKVYTISVASELLPYALVEVQQALQIIPSFHYTTTPPPETPLVDAVGLTVDA